MKLNLILVLVTTIFVITSCQSKEEQWRNPNACDYIKEENRIKVNYVYSYDIIPRTVMGSIESSFSGVGVEMEIFNYGGMLQINTNAIENIYSPMFANISHFYVVSPKDISITNTFNDETYGKWAKGRVFVPDFNRLFENVFISPLAYNYMMHDKPQDDSDCLVLVRLITPKYNRTLNGIFYGNYLIEWIINSDYQHIDTHNGYFSPGGEFWESLFTDEEYKMYKSYLNGAAIGLIPSSYELPSNIVKKLVR